MKSTIITKKRMSRLVSPLFALAVSLLPFGAKAEKNVYTIGAQSTALNSSAQAGFDYLNLIDSDRAYIEAKVNLGNKFGGEVGAVIRRDVRGYNGYGFNGFGSVYGSNSLFSAGCEKLTNKNQLFLNGYFGTVNEENLLGADVGILRDIVHNNKVELSGILGGYFFNRKDESSAGVRVGGRLAVPLSKNRRTKLFFQGDFFSDGEFTGEYSAKAGVSYSVGPENHRPTQRLSANNFDYSSLEELPSCPLPLDNFSPKPNDSSEDPSDEVTGNDGSGNPVGNSGTITGNDGSGNPVGNSGTITGNDGGSD